ncbi:rCG35276 [Rattus norvegicus]|uniref:RCG35276 n=1 Tax=Rattus norvegicus TaxID=10116 RepID=A6HFD2_RAT|nr:rCG35276 [Rattus norvegicus]
MSSSSSLLLLLLLISAILTLNQTFHHGFSYIGEDKVEKEFSAICHFRHSWVSWDTSPGEQELL